MFSPGIGTAAILGGIFGDGLNDGLLGVVVSLVGALVFLTQRQNRTQTKLVAYLCRAVDHFAAFERAENTSHAEIIRNQLNMASGIQRLIEAQTRMTDSLATLVERLASLESKVNHD